MSKSLIHVHAALLEELVRLGPSAALRGVDNGDEVRVYHKPSGESGDTGVSAMPAEQPTTQVASETDKLKFQPQMRYYLEGRIIHKRKLSRKLFFLDVSLVCPKSPEIGDNPALPAAGADANGFILSAWEDVASQGIKYTTEDPSLHLHPRPDHRMEIIARFPVHSLKALDDLWRRVQLGSVVRVHGDIELSERNLSLPESTTQEGSSEPEQQVQQHHWSALLHCLDFEVLESWKGKETFEPNPGFSAMPDSYRNRRREQGHNMDSSGGNGNGDSSKGQGQRKRKSAEMDAGSEATPINSQQQRGDESQPHCKFWLNSGKCNKEICHFWHETDPVKLKIERRRWVEERIQAKRQISHHASDPHQRTTKNQHRERALYFAHWLIETFSRDFLNAGAGVLDIAGGRGDLSWELQTRQGIQSTIVEPRPGKGMRKWQRKWLQKFMDDNSDKRKSKDVPSITAIAIETVVVDDNAVGDKIEDLEEQEPDDGKELPGLKEFIPTTLTYPLQTTTPARIQAMLDHQFLSTYQDLVSRASIVIGLHPDQATEPIVRAALEAGKPFAVIPCCVFGRDNPHRRLPRQKPETTGSEVSSVESSVLERVRADDRGEDEDEDPLTRPVTSYDDFVTWLSTLHSEIETTWLNFEGMNRVLFWRGPRS
ncbi:hypothetical protein BGZ98_008708 [Dissophora globulifera]|nr:hypothetical protein BGZ98_008708 [Dissophora globulifera]